MAKKSMKIKQQMKPKFFCRICFRELAYKGQIPGVKKASW